MPVKLQRPIRARDAWCAAQRQARHSKKPDGRCRSKGLHPCLLRPPCTRLFCKRHQEQHEH
jgi:hypothetical protein